MAAKKKSPSDIDKIDDIDKQVSSDSDNTEEKVISVRIPRRNKDKDTESSTKESSDSKEEKSGSTEKKNTVEEEPTKTKSSTAKPKVKSTTAKEPAISSFSLLDADKEQKKEEVKSTEPTKEAPKSENVNSETDTKGTDETTEKINSTSEKSTEEDIDKWLESTDTLTDTPSSMKPESKGSKLKAFLILLVIVIVLGVIGGGIYYYQTRVDDNVDSDNSTTIVNELPTATPTPTLTPTPEPVDLSDYNVEVLNGSGVSGQAGTIATLLTEEGFADTNAANADNQNYEVTIVFLKEETPQGVYDKLVAILGDQYVLELSEELVDEDSEYDVQVILGSSEPEEESTPTPTEEAGI